MTQTPSFRLQNCGIIALIPIVTLLLGCATVTRGTKDTLVVNSQPSGADVELSNGMTGKTPATFKLPRKNNVVVEVSKAGYETATINVVSQISGAGGAGMAGNVLVGGIIGAAVDAGSGAMNDLKPNPVSVVLNRYNGVDEALGPGPADEKLQVLHRMKKSGLISEGEYRSKRGEILAKL